MIYKIFIYLEGKTLVIGSIALLFLTYLLGRHIIATDTAALISGILAVLGFTTTGITSTQGYQAALGASKKV